MKTIHQSDGETLLVSDELEDRFSYTEKIDTEHQKTALCSVVIPSISMSFDIVGWDTGEDFVDVEVPQRHLQRFFDYDMALPAKAFGHSFLIKSTNVKFANGGWVARMFIDEVRKNDFEDKEDS